MNKYNNIEIQTAENLLENGYMWIVRSKTGILFAHFAKPSKVNNVWCSVGLISCVCNFVPIFQSVRFEDKEPTSLESIVHPQILDDAEKRYLSYVIKPFRDRVKFLKKYKGDLNFGPKYERICGQVRSEWDKNLIFSFDLVPFRTGTMYKGMEVGREYTIEELGL